MTLEPVGKYQSQLLQTQNELLDHKADCVSYKDQSNLTRFVLNLFQGCVSFNSMWVLCICSL